MKGSLTTRRHKHTNNSLRSDPRMGPWGPPGYRCLAEEENVTLQSTVLETAKFWSKSSCSEKIVTRPQTLTGEKPNKKHSKSLYRK